MAMVGVAATMSVGIAALADRRRARRRDLDRVGFMPWPMISVLGTLVALFAFALSLKGAG
jgi:hypothetical protein